MNIKKNKDVRKRIEKKEYKWRIDDKQKKEGKLRRMGKKLKVEYIGGKQKCEGNVKRK